VGTAGHVLGWQLGKALQIKDFPQKSRQKTVKTDNEKQGQIRQDIECLL